MFRFKLLVIQILSLESFIQNWFSFIVGVKDRVNHLLLFVRMAVLVGQGDLVQCVICAEEDGQCEPGMSANENLIIVVAE